MEELCVRKICSAEQAIKHEDNNSYSLRPGRTCFNTQKSHSLEKNCHQPKIHLYSISSVQTILEQSLIVL